MWKRITLRKKKNSSNQGFITLEILVSIIIALAFVAFSLQALVLGMMLKVQAQEDQRADELIQEDIERLNDLGSTLLTGTGTCNANAYGAGYASGLWTALTTEAPTVTTQLLRTVNTDGSITSEGTTLSLNRTHISNNGAYSDAPHRTLKIHYQVTNSDGDIIANRYVEVIPDVALECP
ncbi:MAG: hypothetical protein QNJ70_15415 [Xenococcaceae cyanobacterium MO_207.B15]|nr:hypothetical protein [Xenococcaceae cyanobacterium MO_207.B15]